MTITQTVEIPASRRLLIEVPREVPTGKAILVFKPVPKMEIGEAEEDSFDEFMATGRKILVKHIEAFKALAK